MYYGKGAADSAQLEKGGSVWLRGMEGEGQSIHYNFECSILVAKVMLKFLLRFEFNEFPLINFTFNLGPLVLHVDLHHMPNLGL